MCLYAEEHPTVKQTEIGGKRNPYCCEPWLTLSSNVWRGEKVRNQVLSRPIANKQLSTVSKVLRNKEKYLYQDDGSRSPVRKAKGKFPDIERALSNWAKNHQKQGLPMSDSLIKEKLRFFSMSVGSPDSHLKANNSSWLEKFKQKNNLMGSKSRKNSVVEDSEGPSLPGSGTHTPNISPTSPPPPGAKERSPTAMSITRASEEPLKMESPPESYSEFAVHGGPYRSMSNESLSSDFEATSSSFSPRDYQPNIAFLLTRLSIAIHVASQDAPSHRE